MLVQQCDDGVFKHDTRFALPCHLVEFNFARNDDGALRISSRAIVQYRGKVAHSLGKPVDRPEAARVDQDKKVTQVLRLVRGIDP